MTTPGLDSKFEMGGAGDMDFRFLLISNMKINNTSGKSLSCQFKSGKIFVYVERTPLSNILKYSSIGSSSQETFSTNMFDNNVRPSVDPALHVYDHDSDLCPLFGKLIISYSRTINKTMDYDIIYI